MNRLTVSALAAALAAAAALPAAAQEAPADSAVLARGREYTRWLLEGRTDTLFALLSPRMRGPIPDAARFAALREQLGAQIGEEAEVLREAGRRDGPMQVYTRVSRFTRAPARVEVFFATDSAGRIEGFSVRPSREEAPTRFGDYRTKATLRLPFEGDWYVFWGGRTVDANYHAASEDQRFALDLVVRGPDGRSHAGAGTRNEDYHCWGKPILAPAAGTVVAAVDGIADNVPRATTNTEAPAGNHVMLDLGGGEFALLAHFRAGSLAVRPGETVAAGQTLGECGNSGNSSEPHLHFHLQDGPTLFRAAGLPAQFTDYLADGQPVPRGEPTRGQTIRPRG